VRPVDFAAIARRHLAGCADVHVAPEIPRPKEENARREHPSLPSDEPLILLVDNTLFGAADEGLLATAQRVCWKNILDDPSELSWLSVEPGEIAPDGLGVRIGCGRVMISGPGLPEPLAACLAEMAREAQSAGGGPYRDAAPAHTLHLRVAPGTLLAAAAGLHTYASIYRHPEVPPSKESRVREVHALAHDEPVIVLFDDTVFGSAEEGFVFTPDRLCWKNYGQDPRHVAWGALDPASVRLASGGVRIAGGVAAVTNDEVLARALAEVVVTVAEAARRG
jgi:hypothetical protein